MNTAARLSSQSTDLPVPTRTLVHSGFLFNGMVTTLAGPLIPLLAARWQLSDAQAGWMFITQAAGSMTATTLSGRVAAWLGFRRCLAVGYALMTAGMTGLIFGTWRVCLISVMCSGVGLGLTIPTSNLLISEASRMRRAAALNVLNFFWSLGAMTSPLLVSLATYQTGLSVLAVLLLLTSALLWMAHPLDAMPHHRAAGEDKPAALQPWRQPLLPLVGLFIFLYCGTESSLAGWSSAYALRLGEAPGSIGALSPSIFWATLLLGRLIAPLALRRTTEERLMFGGLLLSLAGIVLLLLTSGVTGLLAGVAVAGAGMSCLFPTTIALLPKYFGASAAPVMSLIFALSSLGSAVLPWLIGLISTSLGSLRSGLMISLSSSLLLIALHLLLRTRHTPATVPDSAA
ncbi:MAG: MFS transporter [Blastocatellia bacterium]